MKRAQAVSLGLILIGGTIAPLPLAAGPATAEEACVNWVAEDWDDEGGPVLTASACAIEDAQVFLSLTCSDGQAGLRYDLAMGAERSPGLEETAAVTFADGADTVTLDMTYEDMDGKFAAYVPSDAPIVGLLRHGKSIAIRDGAGIYPSRSFSLNGSSAAIGKILEGC